ncbi:MAG: hypothetical protein ACK515_03170 [bacterium]|jgi:uncharacterized protein YpmS|nr:hypothetical protein [Betaproteobacteria bacterium]
MLKRIEFILLTLAAAAFLVIVIANVSVSRASRVMQTQLTEQQQFIATTAQLEVLNRELIRALAELAARNNDEAIRSLLSANGITFTVEQKPAPAKR